MRRPEPCADPGRRGPLRFRALRKTMHFSSRRCSIFTKPAPIPKHWTGPSRFKESRMSSSGMPGPAATSRVQLRISLSKSASNRITMAPNLPRTRLARSICCACHACCMKSTTQTAPKIFSPPSPPHRRTRPRAAPQMLAALQFSRSKPRQAVIAGDPQQQATRLLVHSILRDFHPDLVVLYARDANALSGDAAQALAAMRPIQGRPALYLCENFTCRAPVTSPEDARRLLDRIREKSLD